MKDVLVTLSNNDECKSRLEVATQLAERFDAHLTGVYVERQMDFAYYGDVMGTAIVETIQQRRDEYRQAAADLFHKAIMLREDKSTFIAELPVGYQSVFAQASVNDLLVAGQHSANTPATVDRTLTEDLIMRSGRPVLVVPYIGSHTTLGETVLVAWDHSREATRAIHDAMPFLTTAQQVHIVSVVKRKQQEHSVTSADLAEHLARNDVNVVAHDMVKNEVPVAETLLSTVADTGADLLVMGAYGHSRLREYTFGGATRTILDSMTVPVLMAH